MRLLSDAMPPVVSFSRFRAQHFSDEVDDSWLAAEFVRADGFQFAFEKRLAFGKRFAFENIRSATGFIGITQDRVNYIGGILAVRANRPHSHSALLIRHKPADNAEVCARRRN